MTIGLEGGCACGAVRFRINAAPLITHCCHCLDCQRQTGSAFVINALIETSNIDLLSGDPEPYPMPTDSGRPHDIYRCRDCGVALWSDYGGRAHVRFVRVGALDNPDAIAPDMHIYTRTKLPWVRLPENARAFDAFYDLAKEWRPESLARVQAAREKAS